MLSGLQNGMYSKMVDVAMAAAHLQRVYTVFQEAIVNLTLNDSMYTGAM